MAVKYLCDWGYNPYLDIYCNNIWNQDGCKEDLIALRAKYNLEKRVNFVFDGVSEAKLRETYSKSDVFVQAVYVPPPSHHGWGLVNFEAMAAGLPLVLCKSSTATEVLTDGENYLGVQPLSPEQIAQQIKKIIDDPGLYFKIASNGQGFVKDNLSWEKYGRDMLKAFF